MLDLDALATIERGGHPGFEPGPLRFRKQSGQGPADRPFVGPVRGPSVRVADDAAAINPQDRVRRVLDQGTQGVLAVPQDRGLFLALDRIEEDVTDETQQHPQLGAPVRPPVPGEGQVAQPPCTGAERQGQERLGAGLPEEPFRRRGLLGQRVGRVEADDLLVANLGPEPGLTGNGDVLDPWIRRRVPLGAPFEAQGHPRRIPLEAAEIRVVDLDRLGDPLQAVAHRLIEPFRLDEDELGGDPGDQVFEPLVPVPVGFGRLVRGCRRVTGCRTMPAGRAIRRGRGRTQIGTEIAWPFFHVHAR